jgi:hypothetical protein
VRVIVTYRGEERTAPEGDPVRLVAQRAHTPVARVDEREPGGRSVDLLPIGDVVAAAHGDQAGGSQTAFRSGPSIDFTSAAGSSQPRRRPRSETGSARSW